MEASVISRSSSQFNVPKIGLGWRDLRSVSGGKYGKDKLFSRKPNKLSFENQLTSRRNSGFRVTSKAAQAEPIPKSKSNSKSKSHHRVRLFAGLPVDAVSGTVVNNFRAISPGLKAMKLLGLEGVELPIWWGVVENESMGKYEWEGYLTVAEMVRKAGLKLHVTFCFHASGQPKIPLPEWVTDIGKAKSNIFYKDRAEKPYRGCLSLAVDDLPVLNGKTAVQVYQDFCESFKSAFSAYIGSTITGITMGLGPDGEL
ncbi:BETA-AMYLASE 9, beta-amylase 3 [Hibiscus trionum]|uniref:Beta-amylase n=1 Tax=Hibiscus trionum TaxID=183268 RepID=A0A9W7MHF4_HIBTR|nr:BETA-AMYLASE 9, beta-amylase 3 [Hibiscus trionum]